MTIRPRRSLLYMPGSNARALDKARSLPADGLILDLEDAVAPDAKELAREQIVAALAEGGYGHRELLVRINALSTPWGAEDVEVAMSDSDPVSPLAMQFFQPGLRDPGPDTQRVGVIVDGDW